MSSDVVKFSSILCSLISSSLLAFNDLDKEEPGFLHTEEPANKTKPSDVIWPDALIPDTESDNVS